MRHGLCVWGSSSQDNSLSRFSYVSENRLGVGLERREVRCDPIRRHLAVGVGGQDHAVPVTAFHQPGFAKVHRRATGGAGMCGLGRQSRLGDTDLERPAFRQGTSDARALIGAIVGEDDDADLRWRNRSAQPVALLSEGAQASWKPLLFIADGNGDDNTGLDGQGETWQERREGPSSCASRIVKHRECRI
jgi:hypothetical protein